MFSELFNDFMKLDLKWRVMVFIGGVSSIIVIILCILFIVIFKTDLIQIDLEEVNLDKYDNLFEKEKIDEDFLKEMFEEKNEESEESEESKKEIKKRKKKRRIREIQI